MPILHFKMPAELKRGEAIFIIKFVLPKRSTKGNRMLELTGDLKQGNLEYKNIKTWLMLDGQMFFKTKHFFKSINQYSQLEGESLNTDLLLGSPARCLIEIEEDPKFGERPIIVDFLYDIEEKEEEEEPQEKIKTQHEEFKDDDIPF